MEQLISLEKLIEEAKKSGLDFGKGDPYNRLRYYTKIGWLPHMVRKKEEDSENDNTKGHYPQWALKRLIQIENFKAKGLSNDEIGKKITNINKLQGLLNFINSPDTRVKIVTYVSFVILLIILASELEIITLGKAKSNVLSIRGNQLEIQLLDSGVSFLPSSQKKIFVMSKEVQPNSKIYISFNQDYSPATRFWVADKVPLEGFYVELDSPVATNTEFTWWISN